MISFRSVNFYIILFALFAGLLSITGIIRISFFEIISYASILLGLNIFYNSLYKQNRVWVFIGSLIFQLGTIAFVFTKFEILGFGRIIIPTLLFVIGFSLLLTNLAKYISMMANIISIVMITAGITLIINRGSTNLQLYLSSVYAILKNYWIIILAAIAVIYFTFLEIKKRNMDRN